MISGTELHSIKRKHHLGRPLHRLAAVVIDVTLVLAPIHLLLSTPIKRAMATSALTAVGPKPSSYAVISIALAVVLAVLYQTLAHHYFGQTVGKRCFGLTVRGAAGSSRWGAHLTRSLVWVASVALLGVPFLAVFAHERRRPWHDRIGDTLVIALKDGVTSPTWYARGLVHFGYAVLAGALLVSVAREAILWDQPATTEPEDEVGCEAVSHLDPPEHERVKFGLTLFAAGAVDRACLEAEIEREVAGQVPLTPTSYLAQAFVHVDDVEISNAYLDHVCRVAAAGPECAMSHVVNAWSREKWDDVGELFAAAPGRATYLDAWSVRHYMKQARFGEALGALDRLVDHPEVSDFILNQRVRALYGANRASEARQALAQTIPVLDDEPRTELGAWACVQEMAFGCTATSALACSTLKTSGDLTEASDAQRLASLRRRECDAHRTLDYADLAGDAGTAAWRELYLGSAAVVTGQRSSAAVSFRRVIDAEDAPDLLRVEALRRLVMIAPESRLRGVIAAWNDLESPVAWRQAGNILFERLNARGLGRYAAAVGADLHAEGALSPVAEAAFQTLAVKVRAPASEP